jgi:AraC-like DNA-binding protein
MAIEHETGNGSASINEAALRFYPRLQRVEKYVRDRALKEIRLPEVARVAGLEAKYFSAFFRAKVGVRFHDWIRLLRVETAKRFMQEQYTGIPRIAYNSGFRDIRSFERAFKRVVGVTPTQWRAAIQQRMHLLIPFLLSALM